MELDELAFKWPKRIFKGLIVGALVVAIVWGTANWNSKKAWALYEKEIGLIMTPVFNWAENRSERMVGFLLEEVLPELFQKNG